MVRKILALFIIATFTLSTAHADTLFEGYYRVMSGETQIGYAITRYEFDSKKKQFLSTYYLKTGKGASETTESVKAAADSELAPISYEYTSLAGKEAKTIDARFKAGVMTASVKQGAKISKIEKKIPKGTFLSTFLVYLMLKSKEGLRSETKYEYSAIAEEDAAIYTGQALVGKEEMYEDIKVFKILNTFKDIKFLSYVNDRGEVVGTNAVGQGIETKLVATPDAAITGQPYSANTLKTLFGAVPAGTANIISQRAKAKEEQKNAPPASKQLGVPQGQGIIIKAQPDKADSKGN